LGNEKQMPMPNGTMYGHFGETIFGKSSCVIVKVVGRCIVTAEPRVQFWVTSFDIHGGRSITGVGFSFMEFLHFLAYFPYFEKIE
jgi:hypothetical protein